MWPYVRPRRANGAEWRDPDPQESCAAIQVGSPLSPGRIEHECSCEDLGLVAVERNSGGKTVREKWIDVEPIP